MIYLGIDVAKLKLVCYGVLGLESSRLVGPKGRCTAESLCPSTP
jgi:hypothetical protein